MSIEEKKNKEENVNEELFKSNEEMVKNLNNLVSGEFQVKFNELNLWKDLNDHGTKQYTEMKKNIEGLDESFINLKKKYEVIKPVLKEIDEVESNVNRLRTKVDNLDAYVRKLESQLLPYLR